MQLLIGDSVIYHISDVETTITIIPMRQSSKIGNTGLNYSVPFCLDNNRKGKISCLSV